MSETEFQKYLHKYIDLETWKSTKKLIDAKRAFREIVTRADDMTDLPKELCLQIVDSFQMPEGDEVDSWEGHLTQGKKQCMDVFESIQRYEGIRKTEPNMTDIFKQVAKDHGVTWTTVQRNWYRLEDD